MGKRKVTKRNTSGVDSSLKARSLSKGLRKKVSEGILYVESSYNNSRVTLTDKSGNVLTWSTSGALGFKGAKKGTPFAAGSPSGSPRPNWQRGQNTPPFPFFSRDASSTAESHVRC